MPGKNVAVEGDVTATPGTIFFTGAVAGAWTAGPVSYQKYTQLTVQGVAVVHQAQCTFNFSGTGPGTPPPPVVGSETVTLMAKTTALQNGLAFVILNGDTKVGMFGNTLTAIATGLLTST